MTDRPVECGPCKKPICIIYKEIVKDQINCLEMCEKCPVLQQKLYGTSPFEASTQKVTEQETGLFCQRCHTSLETVKTGNPLGCSECYEVFCDVIFSELGLSQQIPSRLKKEALGKKSFSLHIGKSPKQPLNIPSSSRLTTLNEALNEALKKENYEQAAWIRDQIKALIQRGSNDIST